MMKNLQRAICFVLVVLCATLSVDAKIKIKTNTVDKATKDRIIETEWHSFSAEGVKSSVPEIHFRFRYAGGVEYFELRYANNEQIMIMQNYKLRIVPEKGKEYLVDAVSHSVSTIGGGSIDYGHSHKLGFSAVYTGDFIWLLDNKPAILRIETTTRTVDIKLPKGIRKDMQKMFKIFYEKINKHYNKK